MGDGAVVEVLGVVDTPEGAQVETKVTFPPTGENTVVESDIAKEKLGGSSGSGLTALSTSPLMLGYGSLEIGAVDTQVFAPPSPPPHPPPPPTSPPPPLGIDFWENFQDAQPPPAAVSAERDTTTVTIIVAVTISAACISLAILCAAVFYARRSLQSVGVVNQGAHSD